MDKSTSLTQPLLLVTVLFLASLRFARCVYHPTSAQFYIHDTLFAEKNESDTSVLIAAPRGELGALGDGNFHFGALVVFDDPLTRGPSVMSTRVGTAQGMYVYTGRTNISALWSFTAFLDTEDYKGSLSFMGGEIILDKTRVLPVVGGTGDFHLARGIASVNSGKIIGSTYFTLFFNVSLSY